VDVLNEYFAVIGGRPELKGGQKRKGRQSGVKSESATPAASAKKIKTEKAWSPPPGSWEHEVDYIDTVEERVDPKTGEVGKFAYLVWTNEKKTQHPLRHVYQKCPQKVCGADTLYLVTC
jgi:chromobox protein 1